LRWAGRDQAQNVSVCYANGKHTQMGSIRKNDEKVRCPAPEGQ